MKQIREEKKEDLQAEEFKTLETVPFTHFHFNYANYYMVFRDMENAASHFYEVLETSPYRYCSKRQPESEAKEDG